MLKRVNFAFDIFQPVRYNAHCRKRVKKTWNFSFYKRNVPPSGGAVRRVMNKKFTSFFTGYGMTIDGNSAYGIVNGYETNAKVNVLDNTFPVKLHIAFYATDEQKRNMQTAIRNLAIKFFFMQFTQYGLMVGFNDFTVGHLLKRLPSILDTIYSIITDNGAAGSGHCPVCGNALEGTEYKKYDVDGVFITLDTGCVDTINAVISAENQDFKNAPNNYLRGFAGAFIGGLAGVAISVCL